MLLTERVFIKVRPTRTLWNQRRPPGTNPCSVHPPIDLLHRCHQWTIPWPLAPNSVPIRRSLKVG